MEPARPRLRKDQGSVREPDWIVETVVSRQNPFDRRAALDHARDVDRGTGHSRRLQRLRPCGGVCGLECGVAHDDDENRSFHGHTLAQVTAAVVREQSTVIVTLPGRTSPSDARYHSTNHGGTEETER